MKHILLAIGIMVALWIQQGCGNSKSPEHKSLPVVTSYTVIKVALNPSLNQYPDLTAQRTIKDTFRLVVTDSSDGKMVSENKWTRDTSYLLWYPVPSMDSLNHQRKTIEGKDSVNFKFVPVDKSIVVTDYNHIFKQ